MMVASAIPPPSHIVCSPYRPARCSNALTNVVMTLSTTGAQRMSDCDDRTAVDVGSRSSAPVS